MNEKLIVKQWDSIIINCIRIGNYLECILFAIVDIEYEFVWNAN